MTLTQRRLKQLLHYEPDVGTFRWRVQRAYTVPAGTIAGWNNGKGSKRIEIDRRSYLAHRLAWFYVHGTWPKQIDHINRNRSDNRLKNLRPANNSQNQANQGAKSNNSTGYRGIGFKDGVYTVQLFKVERGEKIKVYGRFKSLDEAIEFSKIKSVELHGEFSVYYNKQSHGA